MARILYDQLNSMTSIMLALTASSPIWRGFLADTDCRWKAISESQDDRSPEERGEIKNSKVPIIEKSRYSTVESYLSDEASSYNDIEIVKNETYYEYLKKNGVDHLMAQHISHLFIRDPLIIFKEDITETPKYLDSQDFLTNQFENIQSTNWQSMRFKPPPNCDPNSETGWRVEFRTMELQGTDFENAAFVTFLVLLSRAILEFKLDLLIPISQVDENTRRAQKRNACLAEKFYFKTLSGRIKEMSINEIMNGDSDFPGLIKIIKDYLSSLGYEEIQLKTHYKIFNYLKLIENKSNGKCKTTATWMRDFVTSHKKYEFDSIVTDEIAYDLMWNLHKIANGVIKSYELNGIY